MKEKIEFVQKNNAKKARKNRLSRYLERTKEVQAQNTKAGK